ncbi:A-kinase anchor protein 17A isoform 1-T1 [Glossina fuscipes fuscipes]
MINIQTIQYVADCIPLYLPHSLYLKPVAKINISVALPSNKTGKSISNLDIMEKLSFALKPDKFLVLKVSKSTVDFIRFEAELDERSRLRSAINRLDGISLKLPGFNESFRVRASESKDDFPTRHDWDSFFRDASNMDEMKAGERPDTIHISHLPIKWFCPRHLEHEDNAKPSESIFKRIFEKFGSVRCVDIPICDPYRNKMNADINGMKTFSFEQDVLFEAYVQFDEYVGFVRAMDEFRGMKLVRKFVDKTQAVNISANFDTTKHLSDAQNQRRERVRKRLIAKVKADEEEKERKKKLEKERLERERQRQEEEKLAELERQREREERRKEKHLKRIQEKSQIEISQKIRVEERKLMIAQRKLESIRILEQLFDRMKLKHLAKYGTSTSRKYQLEQQKDTMRERLVEKYKTATEKLLMEQKRKVEDIRNKTPLMGLLKSKKTKGSSEESADESDGKRKVNSTNDAGANTSTNAAASTESQPMNPFKAVAALATGATANPYNTEAASEWMKSLMFPYVPPMFPGMSHLYRPPAYPVSGSYRSFAPRMRMRIRGRGRGRGMGYDNHYPSNHYYNKHYNHGDNERYNDDEDGGGGGSSYYHYKSYARGRNRLRSRTRSRDRRSRSRSRTRTRSRSHSRSRSRDRRSRTRSRHRHYSKRTRSHTRSRSRSYSRSRSRTHSKSRLKSREDKRSKSPNQQMISNKPPEKINKKLASTRRSRSYSSSSHSRSRSRTRNRSRSRTRTRSRSHSRSARSRRSWSRRSSSHRSPSKRKVIIDSDKLVRSAEEIKRTIEKDMKERMREEEREIKETFNKRHKQVLVHNAAITAVMLRASASESGIGTAEHSANESSVTNSAQDKEDSSKEGGCDDEEDEGHLRKHFSRPSSRRHSFEAEVENSN